MAPCGDQGCELRLPHEPHVWEVPSAPRFLHSDSFCLRTVRREAQRLASAVTALPLSWQMSHAVPAPSQSHLGTCDSLQHALLLSHTSRAAPRRWEPLAGGIAHESAPQHCVGEESYTGESQETENISAAFPAHAAHESQQNILSQGGKCWYI